MNWPATEAHLVSSQRNLARARPPQWTPEGQYLVGGAWICFPRGLSGKGSAGDRAWAAAVVMDRGGVVGRCLVPGQASAPYVPGLLALRLGPLLADVVRRLAPQPDVLLLDGTGRDHPRRAGLALQLGAVLELPTVGVTHRPLTASGDWPADVLGAASPLFIGPDQVATWLRTKQGTHPLVVHPGWRTDLASAVAVATRSLAGHRTPEPLRRARQAARLLREP
ncbi:endonuclease V [Kribbella turkmenica]|uniref:Endonuclease V n=1 Tax=Kribbella turkmenica TaxID=2530375 RepID=A0A4R4XF54_9ACTN|nr:endonuclease V [Kribbella turkmenica]TDD29314.1 endonuclease V [Kribbella turkmenica]